MIEVFVWVSIYTHRPRLVGYCYRRRFFPDGQVFIDIRYPALYRNPFRIYALRLLSKDETAAELLIFANTS